MVSHGILYNIFFGIIGFMMLVSTALQFYAAYDLDDVCDDKLVTAPMTAGITLLVLLLLLVC